MDISLGLRVYAYIYGRCWYVRQRASRFIVWSADWYEIAHKDEHQVNKGAVLITSSKQTIVAKSSKEVEMIAVSDHTREPIAQNEFYIN